MYLFYMLIRLRNMCIKKHEDRKSSRLSPKNQTVFQKYLAAAHDNDYVISLLGVHEK